MTPLAACIECEAPAPVGEGDCFFSDPGVPESKQVNYRAVALHLPVGPLFPFDGTDTRRAEQYRMLRTNILLHPARPKMIAVSSANPGDGKTVTSINLAGT